MLAAFLTAANSAFDMRRRESLRQHVIFRFVVAGFTDRLVDPYEIATVFKLPLPGEY